MSKELKVMSPAEAQQYVNSLAEGKVEVTFESSTEGAMAEKLSTLLEQRKGLEEQMKTLQEKMEQGEKYHLATQAQLELIGNMLVEFEDDRRADAKLKAVPTADELEAVKDL